jgi:FkbM family methyltransferase
MTDTDLIAAGVKRSLAIYYGDPVREAAMDRLHARFLSTGDLAFDIGAHVGDRVASFRRLGARVVAVEPQPALAAVLGDLFANDRSVVIEPVAVGVTSGEIELLVNEANPTVTTASADFVTAARGAPGWDGQAWTGRIRVPVVTLAELIERHGTPRFVKIDVEGLEAAVLAGLDRPLDALSFEFTTIQKDVAYRCLEVLTKLGIAKFDVCLGESQTFVFGEWVDATTLAGWIRALPLEANSGDVYATA